MNEYRFWLRPTVVSRFGGSILTKAMFQRGSQYQPSNGIRLLYTYVPDHIDHKSQQSRQSVQQRNCESKNTWRVARRPVGSRPYKCATMVSCELGRIKETGVKLELGVGSERSDATGRTRKSKLCGDSMI